MNPKKLLEEQLKLEEAGRPYAVVTIIRADGAVPRKSGKMLVTADGNRHHWWWQFRAAGHAGCPGMYPLWRKRH